MIAVKFRSHRLAVRTLAFHVGNRGSSPLGITIYSLQSLRVSRDTRAFFCLPFPVFSLVVTYARTIRLFFLSHCCLRTSSVHFLPSSHCCPYFVVQIPGTLFQSPAHSISTLYSASTWRNRGLAVAVDLNLCYKDGTCAKSS